MTGGAATPERVRLIMNADDFGFSDGVTRGIIEAHAAGTVTSTSMMANGLDWEGAVRFARATRTCCRESLRPCVVWRSKREFVRCAFLASRSRMAGDVSAASSIARGRV